MNERVAALLERVKEKRAYVHDAFNRGRSHGARPADVRRVLVIDSASRSGSSFLYFLLSRHRDVLSLNGEGSLFERLHGVGTVRSTADSDFVPPGQGATAETIARIAEDLLKDAGTLGRHGADEAFPRDGYVADSVQRLILQYPEIDFDPDRLRKLCDEALGALPANGARFSSLDYWRKVLEALARASFPVSPRHYDLQGSGPMPGKAESPPPPFADYVLEDPPFIVPEPRIFPPPERLPSATLLLKSPSHCYRMWMVRKMFPNARFKFVVLVRNPAATISSLMDGWTSGGFYSHNLGHLGPLDIEGYTRAEFPWTRKWWKFDLPPGWAALRARPLPEVCGRQWLRANEHIRKDISDKVVDDHIVVRYESLLEPRSLETELARIGAFAGLEGPHFRSGDVSRPVMSVTPPAAGKWRKRTALLAPLLAGKEIREMARAAGYDPAGWESWP